jgi:hypothetical protein
MPLVYPAANPGAGNYVGMGAIMRLRSIRTILAFCALSSTLSPALMTRETNQAIEDEVNILYGSSPDIVKTQAVDRLVAIGPDAIPLLVPVICDKSKPNFDLAWPFAAKALGELKAKNAAACLATLLAYNFPPIGPASMKSDETITQVDPAFAPLIEIGEPGVYAIRAVLPFLHPEGAYVALRVLRRINTPSAREAVDAYIKYLNNQIRLANTVLDMWDK